MRLAFLVILFAAGCGTGYLDNDLLTRRKPGKTIDPGTPYHVQLSGKIKQYSDVKVYDVDLFDTSREMLDDLKRDGRTVICYFSAGSAEDWRDDYSAFPTEALGKALEGWKGEKWVDTRNQGVRAVMASRIAFAQKQGCDGVDPDNVDGYSNKSGFPLTEKTQIDYNSFLAKEAHARGLLVALKNSAELAQTLEPKFDFAVVEECFKYDECEQYSPFVKSGKAVFMIEYGKKKNEKACKKAASLGFDLTFYDANLSGKTRVLCE